MKNKIPLDFGVAESRATVSALEFSAPANGIARRRLLQIGATSLLTLGAFHAKAADAPPSSALVSAARKEGTLTLYTSSEMAMTQKWCGQFTDTYGVSVKVVRGPGYPIFDRWLNEERVGRHFADVMQLSDPTLLDMAFKQGFIATYKPVADSAIYPEMQSSGVWYALRASTMGIGYNSNVVNAADEQFLHTAGWNALTDPRWKGRCATAAAGSGGSTYAYNFMFMVALKEQYGLPFLHKWAANKPDVYISKPPMFDRLDAGQYAIGDEATSTDMTLLYLKGAPVRWVNPDPTPTILTAQCISSHAPHPNAARLFTEWCLGVAGQTAWMQFESTLPSRPDVVDPRKAKKQAWFADSWYSEPKTLYIDYLRDPAFADPTKPLIPEWNKIFGYDQAG
jgi:iron(III) transport system substrate-binding protein